MATTYAKTNIQILKIADLNPAEYNARFVTNEALAGLSKSMEAFGLLSFPVINKRADGYRIVGGHQRIRALKEQGEKTVTCVVVEFDDAKEKEANLALNNRAIQGTFVPELTKALLDQIRESVKESQPELFNELRFNALLKTLPKPPAAQKIKEEERAGRTDDDDEPGMTRSSVDSKPGHYYRMGEHVLFLGRVENVGLLKGFPVDRADMAFTRIAEKKDITQAYLDLMLSKMMANTDGAIFVPTNLYTLPELQARFEATGGEWSDTLMWYLPEVAGSVEQPYKDIVLPVMYGWRKGESHYFGGARSTGNLLKLKKVQKTAVPVEVIVKCLLDGVPPQHYVLDLDAGSGATVIAAEKTNRRVIGYVNTATEMDSIRKRWTDFSMPEGANWKTATGIYEGKP